MYVLTIPINISYVLLLTGYYIGLRADLWIFIVRDVIMAYLSTMVLNHKYLVTKGLKP